MLNPALQSVQAHRRSPDMHSPWGRPGSPSDMGLLLAGNESIETKRQQPRADWHPKQPKRGSGASGILASAAEEGACGLCIVGLCESFGLLVRACTCDCKRLLLGPRHCIGAPTQVRVLRRVSTARPTSRRARCSPGSALHANRKYG